MGTKIVQKNSVYGCKWNVTHLENKSLKVSGNGD